MTVILDPAPAPTKGGLTKLPGDFPRSSAGTPYVTDPSGALVKSGHNKGLPKLLAYGRPSGFGDQIEDSYNLTKWSERKVVLGIALGDDEARAACFNLAYYADDCESAEFKAAADGVIVAAKAAAKSMLDADRGTYMHSVCLEGVGTDEGAALGIPIPVERDLAQAWRQMLADYGLHVLGVELPCVNDDLRTAGTLDAHVRLTRELRLLGPGGEVVILAAGTVLVLDLKTGKLRRKGRQLEHIQYWASYPLQIAAYAGSVPYDTDTETRGEWGYEIDQRWALLAHLNTREAIAGEPAACTLVLVDIAAGRAACDVVVAAKNWEKRTDVMTVQPPQIASGEATHPSASSDAEPQAGVGRSVSPASACPPEQENPCTSPSLTMEQASTSTSTPAETSSPTSTLPTPQRDTTSSDDSSSPSASPTPTPSAPASPSISPTSTPTTRADVLAALGYTAEHGHVLDEGDPVTPADFAVLEAAYNKVDADGQRWFQRIVKESAQASVPFGAHHNKTVRRYELYRGLIALAADGNFARDEVVRGLVSTVLDTEAALFPTLTVGHVVGVMSADEAKRFALLCDELVAT